MDFSQIKIQTPCLAPISLVVDEEHNSHKYGVQVAEEGNRMDHFCSCRASEPLEDNKSSLRCFNGSKEACAPSEFADGGGSWKGQAIET